MINMDIDWEPTKNKCGYWTKVGNKLYIIKWSKSCMGKVFVKVGSGKDESDFVIWSQLGQFSNQNDAMDFAERLINAED